MDFSFAKAQRLLLAALVGFVVLAIFPFTPDPAVDIKVLGYELCAFLALLLWLLTPRHALETVRRSSAFFPLFVAFLALNIGAALVSANVGYSLLRECVKWSALFILFLVAADVYRTPKQVWGLASFVCIAVSIASVYGFLQYLGKDPFPWTDPMLLVGQAPATFGNPNVASHTLALALILACGLSTRPRGRWALLLVPLYLGHLAITQTRGSLLALAGAFLLVLVALIVSRTVKRPARAIAATLGVVLLIAVLSLAGIGMLVRLKTGQSYPAGESITLRYQSFYGAARLIQDKPWLGHGPGMYEVVGPEHWTTVEKEQFSRQNRMSYHVHNEPLEIAADAGLLAGIVYLAILVLGTYYGLSLAFGVGDPSRRRLGMTLAAFFFAFMLDGFFGFNVHVPSSATLLFVFAGATAGLWRERETASERRAFRFGGFPLAWRLAALGCAAVIPILGVRDFTAQFWLERGLGATFYKEYPAAAECIRKAQALAPYNWLYPFHLGLTEMQLDHPAEAAALFGRTLALNPNYLKAQFKIAEALFNVATRSSGTAEPPELNRALGYAKRAAQLNPFSPEVYDLWGRATILRAQRLSDGALGAGQEAEKAWSEAEQHFQEALNCSVKDKFKLYNLLAIARMQGGDAQGAQKALIRSLEDKPSEAETWRLFWQVSQRSGQYDALETSLTKRIEELGGPSDARREELGILNLLQAQVLYAGYGDVKAAEETFLRVVEESPAKVDAWTAFYAFAKSAGREDAFIAALSKAGAATEKAEKDFPPQVRAAALAQGSGEDGVVSGVALFMDALQRYQSQAKSGAETAEQFAWAAELLAARAQQVSLSPENAGPIFFRLGLAFGAFRDFNAAAQLLDRATPFLSGADLQQCLLRKGAALAEAGNTAGAVEAFEQAAANDPASFDARYALAQALVQDGQRDKARAAYRELGAKFELSPEGKKAIQQALEALQ